MAKNRGLIGWDCGAIDASFSPGKGGGAIVKHGYKGKGILIHMLVDGEGMPLSAGTTPANGNQPAQVDTLLEQVKIQTGKPGRPAKRVKRIAADKGYDSQALRESLGRKGIQPQIA